MSKAAKQQKAKEKKTMGKFDIVVRKGDKRPIM